MIPVGFHPEARLEFLQSTTYYETQQPGLGRRFVEAATDVLRRIQARPLLYREIEGGCRQCRIPRFPYGIIYRMRGDRIEVIAVMHLHRLPRYWQDRT
jgi:plasmid stabilization system protein ParE